MNVDLGLKKIASLELDKKDLLLKLINVNTLIDKVRTENMLLLDKIKNLELELSVVREQTNRGASFKLDHMLRVQKSPLDKTGLGFVEIILMSKTHSTNFVPSSKPPKCEIVKLVEVTPPLGRLGLILKSLSLRILTPLRIRCMIDLYGFVFFCGKIGYIRPNCFKLQAAK